MPHERIDFVEFHFVRQRRIFKENKSLNILIKNNEQDLYSRTFLKIIFQVQNYQNSIRFE